MFSTVKGALESPLIINSNNKIHRCSKLAQHNRATPLKGEIASSSASLHPTLQLIHQRHQKDCRPGKRSDDFKLGLVVEGGGMLGIISGAMLMQLDLLGLRHTFDAVYGASAGSINAAYFIAQQNKGLDVYTENLSDGNFLDLSLLLPKSIKSWSSRNGVSRGRLSRPPMDLDFLVDYVMQTLNPLDFEAVIESPLKLKVIASSLDELRPIILQSFSSRTELAACLKASATIPELAGPPRVVQGHRCVDAAVFEPVPVASAINDGCTHLLVLCTRTPADPIANRRPLARLAKQTLELAVKKTVMNPDYMRKAWKSSSSDVSYIHDEMLLGALNDCPNESCDRLGAYVMPLYPSSVRGTNSVCMDVRRLKAARGEGWRSVQHLVGRPLGLNLPAGVFWTNSEHDPNFVRGVGSTTMKEGFCPGIHRAYTWPMVIELVHRHHMMPRTC